jgi:hypothetical protein
MYRTSFANGLHRARFKNTEPDSAVAAPARRVTA